MATKPRGWTGTRTPSALKRVRTTKRRTEVNGPRRSEAKTLVVKALKVAAAAGKATAEAPAAKVAAKAPVKAKSKAAATKAPAKAKAPAAKAAADKPAARAKAPAKKASPKS